MKQMFTKRSIFRYIILRKFWNTVVARLIMESLKTGSHFIHVTFRSVVHRRISFPTTPGALKGSQINLIVITQKDGYFHSSGLSEYVLLSPLVYLDCLTRYKQAP